MILIYIYMKHKFLFLSLALLLFCGHAFSQQKLSLTLSEAQKFALEHNRTLKNASLDVQKSEASRWQTIASMLPQLSASFDYMNMFNYKMSLMGYDISMPSYGTFGGTASVAVSAAQIIGVQIGAIATEMSKITLKQTERQTTDQVKTIYYSSLVMEETVVLLEKNLENLNNLQLHTEQSVKVGVAEQTDADQISVQVASMKAGISSTKRSLEMLYNMMRLQLGVDVDTEIVFSQSLQELMNVDKTMLLLSEDFVLGNNFNYQLLMQSVELSEKQVEVKKWAYAPTVSAYYQYTKKKYFSDDATMDMTPPNVAGVTLNVPIWSSGSRLKALSAAKLDYRKQLNTLSDTEEALKIQHSQLRYNLTSAFESYETQKKNIDVSQRVFDNVSRKYQQGIASSIEVTTSGTNLVSAQSSYVKALMELVSAQIALEELLNKDK
jgi:outer membrane protein TolC